MTTFKLTDEEILRQKRSKTTIDDFLKDVEYKGGKIHPDSPPYINARTKMRILCGFNDHPPFLGTLSTVRQGQWCPNCAKCGGLREEICRAVLMEAFNDEFEKTRKIDWLVSEQGVALELDCYNPRLKIALEHQGYQHYRFVNFFHRTEEEFNNLQQRDARKRKLCQENNVILIEVPESVHILEIRTYIRNLLNKCSPKLELQPIVGSDTELINNIRTQGPHTSRMYSLIKKIVEEGDNPKGRVISTVYISNLIPMEFECIIPDHGRFTSIPKMIKRGNFCRKCGIKKVSEINSLPEDELRQKIEQHNLVFTGETESRKEKTRSVRYAKVQCINLHEPYWISVRDLTYRKIENLESCKQCNLPKVSIKIQKYNNLKKYVEESNPRLGTVISTEYITNKTKMTFKCMKPDHKQFEMRPNNIMSNGSFCPMCKIDKTSSSRSLKPETLKNMLEPHGLEYADEFKSEQIGNKTVRSSKVKCKQHGTEFWLTNRQLSKNTTTKSLVASCNQCSKTTK